MKKRMFIAALVALLSNISLVYAELVTYEFSADVFFVDDMGQVLNGSVNSGDTITGTYTIDTNTPDTSIASYMKMYHPMTGTVGFNVHIGPHTIQTDPYIGCHGIQFYNFFSDYDTYDSWSDCGFSGTLPTDHMSLSLYDPTATALTGDEDINTHPPELSNWREKTFRIIGPGYFIDSVVTMLQVAPPSDSTTLPVEIMPGNGTILGGQAFDLAIFIDESLSQIANVSLQANGNVVNEFECSPLMPIEGLRQAKICGSFDTKLNPGLNTLNYQVDYIDGSSIVDQIQWNMVLPLY